jgi:2,3-dihydroxybenzoate decarboxylase
MRKIALEEHFLSPGFEDYWLPTMGGVDQKAVSGLLARLKDFGDTRVAAMDSTGIARAVLSISGPGVQVERDAATARRRAAEANDFLAGEVAKRPDRYSGFGHLPMQDAHAAADELERCVRDLKFCGAMINAIPTASISIIYRCIRSGSAPKRWAQPSTFIRPIRFHPLPRWQASRA